ncbi:MAG TPA: adenylyltransferase/cytidyltransferase family protein [Bacteroidales bacterium]|nr:adenylyltransferase/cytidyltransferase family protein [Bacteroidales bacterium]
MKKVFVSGCYDMLHSGHVAFFEAASKLGDLYVGIGSDATIAALKGRRTLYTESERLYMVRSMKYVKDAWVNRGSGLMDFVEEVLELKPDIFFVNEDGYTVDKQDFCRQHGIELVVSRRLPVDGLPVRSTTALRKECRIPYRLDLAGGWLDQPFVSKYFSGPVITISLEPDIEFNDRSGMASSTRAKAIELWQTELPDGDRERLAKTLFCYENPPGNKYVSGSQDSIGIVFPGLNKLDYPKGDYWPGKIINTVDEEVLRFIEDSIYLINLSPRGGGYNVLSEMRITAQRAEHLAISANMLWESALAKDLPAFGNAMRNSFEAQISMFPLMVNKHIEAQIESYKNKVHGWKISGAGGGGYLVLVSDKPVENALRIRIRR